MQLNHNTCKKAVTCVVGLLLGLGLLWIGTRSPLRGVLKSSQLLARVQAEAQAGQVENIQTQLAEYAKLRPNNPIGHIQLAKTLDHACLQQKPAACTQAEQVWLHLNLDATAMLNLAYAAAAERDWAKTQLWLTRLKTRFPNERSFNAAYLAAVTAIITHSPQLAENISAVQQYPTEHAIFPLGSSDNPSLTISGSALRWLQAIAPPRFTFGTPLESGYLWFSGAAGIIVHIPNDDTYTLTFSLLNGPAPPIEIALMLNDKAQKVVSLARGDSSWQTFSINVSLAAGYHVIGIAYLNDVNIDGVDRNAAIQFLAIAAAR